MGRVLCRSFRVKTNGVWEEDWFYEPGGKHVSRGAAWEAVNSGFLRPQNDGLFVDTTQTFGPA